MIEWKEYELGDICSRLSSGKSIRAAMISDSAEYAVYGGNTIEELKNVLKSSIKRENELISIEKKIKTSLKNIEFELFRKIKTLESYD